MTDGNGRAATATVEIFVGAVNDAPPVLTVPDLRTPPGDAAVGIAGIGVADVDVDEVRG